MEDLLPLNKQFFFVMDIDNISHTGTYIHIFIYIAYFMTQCVCGKLLTLKFYELCNAIVPAQGKRYVFINPFLSTISQCLAFCF